jgi:hypothetical protein
LPPGRVAAADRKLADEAPPTPFRRIFVNVLIERDAGEAQATPINLTDASMTTIENVTPILRVENLETSRDYYTGTLGFSVDWDAGGMISVSRDGKPIMLCEGEQGHPGTWLWIGVEDADVFFTEFVAKGARIRSAPRNFSWAYEFAVEDPDGHVLRFGSGPKSEATSTAL